MKLVYLFVFIAFIVILLLGKSIFSSAKAVTNAASGSSIGQTGGKKASTLRTLLYVILAVAAVIFILSNVRVHFVQLS
jgi:uncharacterized membrane protein YuzA (DUF378 family)